MLHYALIFFIVAIVAAVFGFSGIAAGAAGIAKILFILFLIGAAVAVVLGLVNRSPKVERITLRMPQTLVTRPEVLCGRLKRFHVDIADVDPSAS